MSRLRRVLVACSANDHNYMETTVDKTGFIAERKQQQHDRINKRCLKPTYRFKERGAETRFPVCFLDTNGLFCSKQTIKIYVKSSKIYLTSA